MSEYSFDAAWDQERERLAGIERLWDPGTKDILDSLPIADGWRCLEVGAGGGSIAEWLCDRVGTSGCVVATDLDTRFIDAIDKPNLETRSHNLLTDPPLGDTFDLVHARLLVEHLGAHVIPSLVAALRPGGVLVLEDYDFTEFVGWPEDQLCTKVREATLGVMRTRGLDPQFGRKLVNELRSAGLDQVQASGRTAVVRGGTPEMAFYRLSVTALRDRAVQSRAVTDAEVDHVMRLYEDPSFTFVMPTMISAWGNTTA